MQFNQHDSVDFIVNSGVPQGSHLGPTLFLLFINDIVEKLPKNIFISLYADDLKLAAVIESAAEVENLQAAIDKLKMWCDENYLHLNLNKCSVLTIGQNRNKILNNYMYGDHIFNRVSEQRDLGVIIDSKLNFNSHINCVVSKAKAAFGFVKRFCYDVKDYGTQKSLFYALVQSLLDYCSVVWLPFYKIHKEKIESILKQFTMFALREYPSVTNNFKISSFNERLCKLDMQSLQRRRLNSATLFMYDLIHNNIHCPGLKNEIGVDANARALRRSEHIKIKNKQLRLIPTAPITQIANISNKVAELFKLQITRNSFKSKLLNLNDDNFSHLSEYVNSNVCVGLSID